MEIANPKICMSCEHKKFVKVGIGTHVYCHLGKDALDFDMDHTRFIGISHAKNEEDYSMTPNIDFMMPEDCAYKFEHMLAQEEQK